MTDKLEMPLEQFAIAASKENERLRVELTAKNAQLFNHREMIERLTSGPGGIMEMKQTIANKEAEIERLQQYESTVKFIAEDYLELSYDKAQWQRDDWLKRCRKTIAEEK